MEDYPRTLAELKARLSTEEACLEYLFVCVGLIDFVALLAVEEKPRLLEKFFINAPLYSMSVRIDEKKVRYAIIMADTLGRSC